MIVELKKLLMVVPREQQTETLRILRDLQAVHVDPAGPVTGNRELENVSRLADVIKGLKLLDIFDTTPILAGDGGEESRKLLDEVLELGRRVEETTKQQADSEALLASLGPWAVIDGARLSALREAGLKIRVWSVPTKGAQVAIDGFEVDASDRKYLVTILPLDPIPPGLIEVAPPSIDPSTVRQRIVELERARVSAQDGLKNRVSRAGELVALKERLQARWSTERVMDRIYEDELLVGITGWLPSRREAELKEALEKHGMVAAVWTAEPETGENPPTLIENPRWVQAILDVLKIYAVPGYREWDPSLFVLFFFAVFFGFIVSDAGYGALLLTIMGTFARRLKGSEAGARFLRLGVALGIVTFLVGALSGTWFAVNLPDGHLLRRIQVIDGDDMEFMMSLSILLGVFHLSISRVVKFGLLWPSQTALCEVGWIAMMWGGLFLYWGIPFGKWMLVAGGIVAFLFASDSPNPIKRLLGGLSQVLGLSQTFADILSYLRLFALGLAGVYMGRIFNDLGVQVAQSWPGWGYIPMVLIIFVGHTINFGLALMGGTIHGLRLNFLEFYRYSFEGTGRDYEAYR